MKTYRHFILTCTECGETWDVTTCEPKTETEVADWYGGCEMCPSSEIVAKGKEK